MPRAHGLTLVEVLVALTLLSMGALAAAGSGATAIRAAREGRTAHDDAALARDSLEQRVAAGCQGSAGHRLVAARVPRGRWRGATLFAVHAC